MIDVTESDLIDENDKNLYVGSSRAKYELAIVALLSEEDCKNLLTIKGLSAKRNYKKALATSYNTRILKENSDI